MKQELSAQRLAVIQKISTAFADVRLEDGIGLAEAQAIDDYQDAWTQAESRKLDEKEDWRRISREQLLRSTSSLSFFDAKGMRFHLPAFLIAELQVFEYLGCVFHLVELDDYARSKLALLNSEQKDAVEACLWEMLDDKKYSYDHEGIARAIKSYWSIRS
jgi:hypothetical protein